MIPGVCTGKKQADKGFNYIKFEYLSFDGKYF